MKTVYVDVLVTVNIFTDFFLLLCVKKFLNIRAKLIRIILGSFIGGILSLTALLPKIPAGLNIIIDILFAAVIVFFAFGKTEIKNYIKRVAVYFGISFFFCGIMIFVYTSFKPKGMEIYNDVIYFNISPFLLIILTLVFYYAMKLWGRFSGSEIGKSVCTVRVFDREKQAEFKALVDSGCHVREPFSGDYVIIAEKELLQELEPPENTMRVIPFESLGGKGIIKGFLPEQIMIDGKLAEQSLYVGICENILKGDVRAIIPFEAVKN